MKCEKIAELLIAYLDREVSEEEQQAIEVHLNDCLHCKNELESFVDTREKLHQAFQIETAQSAQHAQVWANIKQNISMNAQADTSDVIGLASLKILRRIKMYILGQPRWRTATAGILALALIVAMSLVIPSLGGGTDLAIAASKAAQDSEAVKTASGGVGDVEVLTVSVSDNQGQTICTTAMGQVVRADIDMDALKVVMVEILDMPELNEEERQLAINIAELDSRVKKFMDEGATTRSVFPIYNIFSEGNQDIDSFEPNIDMAVIELVYSDESTLSFIEVNLEDKTVESIEEIDSSTADTATSVASVIVSENAGWEEHMSLLHSTDTTITLTGANAVTELTEEDKAKAIEIAGENSEVKDLLEQGGSIGEAIGCLNVGFIRQPDGSDTAIVSDSEQLVLMQVELEGQIWMVAVDLAIEQVRVTEIQTHGTSSMAISSDLFLDSQESISTGEIPATMTLRSFDENN